MRSFPRFIRPLLFTLGLIVADRATAKESVPQTPSNSSPILKKMILAESEAAVLALPPDVQGGSQIVFSGLPLLADQELAESLAPAIGKALDIDLINAIGNVIRQFGIKKDRVLSVVVPNQDASGGVLRIAVIFGTYRDISFKGNRWFSAKMLREKLGVRAGDPVSISRLDEAVNWANTNPFRRIQVMLNPVAQATGQTDLIVGVEERIPLRLLGTFENSGNEVIGENQFSGMVQYGNVFGRDHQFTYQLVTTERTSVYRAQSIDYRIPLPWRHVFQVSGYSSLVRPTFLGGLFTQDAKHTGANVRYTIPFKRADLAAEWFGLIDFKRSNNNLEYGGQQVLATGNELFHFGTGISAGKQDRHGGWTAGANLMFSPGRMTPRNRTLGLREARLGASELYVYGNVSVQRSLKVGAGWDLLLRGFGQLTTDNLLGSEQITLGGANTVRGFDSRIYAADQGLIMNVEINTPQIAFKLPGAMGRRSPALIRFLGFYDAGHVTYKHTYPSDLPFSTLAAAGIGLRAGWANNFGVSADYGIQMTSALRPVKARSQGHLKVSLAY